MSARDQFSELGGRDPYEVLGVARDAGEDEIVKAKRRRQREVHSDLTGGDEEDSKLVNAAAAVLLDPGRRADWDWLHRKGADPAGGGPVGTAWPPRPPEPANGFAGPAPADEGVPGFGTPGRPPEGDRWTEPAARGDWASRDEWAHPEWNEAGEPEYPTRLPARWLRWAVWGYTEQASRAHKWFIWSMRGQVGVLVFAFLLLLDGSGFVGAAARHATHGHGVLAFCVAVLLVLPVVAVHRRMVGAGVETILLPLFLQTWLVLVPLYSLPVRFWTGWQWLIVLVFWWAICAGAGTLLVRASASWPSERRLYSAE